MQRGKLTGKVAIVTGAASGIGRATALALAAEGAAVVLADLSGDGAERVAREITDAGGRALAQLTDVGDESSIAAMVEAAVKTFGGLDVLHNNAAATEPTLLSGDLELTSMDVAIWDRTLAINLRGPMLGCKHAIPRMLERGGGVIVNTSSAAALAGDLVRSAYGASKAGLDALTRYVATQYGKRGIRCNSIAPGVIATPALAANVPPEQIARLRAQPPHAAPRPSRGHREGGRVPRVGRRRVHHRAGDLGRRRPARAPPLLLRFPADGRGERVSAASDRFAFDPFDASQTQEMWDTLAAMRREAPISRPIAGFVYVARYADVKEVFRDARTFSSREGFRGAGIVVPDDECFLGEIDPPAHPKLRELLRQAFRPGLRTALGTVHARVRRAQAARDRGAPRRRPRLRTRYPSSARRDRARARPAHRRHRADRTLGLRAAAQHLARNQPHRARRRARGRVPRVRRFLDEQIALRRSAAAPPDDLLTSLVGAADAGTVLSDVQVRTLAANCLLASQSTANLVGNLLHRFVSDAGFERRLRSDRGLVPAAIEESLRFEPPVLFLFRTARHDTALSSEKIHEGERVILGIASGNRDETVYERADEFRIERWPGAAQHLTFGPGPHLCLGNQLARMEARVVLELVMDLFPEGALRLAPGYQRHHVPMFLEYGPERLDVVIGG